MEGFISSKCRILFYFLIDSQRLAAIFVTDGSL